VSVKLLVIDVIDFKCYRSKYSFIRLCEI